MLYRIALVDDHPEILARLARELNALGSVDIVFTARNGLDYLQQMKYMQPDLHPQVVIMDIEMPIMGGIEAVSISYKLYSDTQYIMFTVSDDDDKLFDAIRAGADSYLLKNEPVDAIFNSIEEVIDKNGAPMSPGIARKALKLLSREYGNNQPYIPVEAELSEIETEILKGMVAGLNYTQIAEKLFLSPFTVRNHISNIYSKLHITPKAQAVKVAVDNKWV